ncbi:MAG: PqqD family protein [Actinomycetota bacterium]|nr:PqqD family protein [Actinomycetota bacterium]
MSDTRYRRCPQAVWRATRFFLVAAVPPATPTHVGGSAAAVWHALAHEGTLPELVGRVAAEVGAPADDIAADVRALVHSLLPLGLVEVVA